MTYSVQVRREFWGLVGQGVLPRHAAVAVGVNMSTGRRWFVDAGGVRLRDVSDADVHRGPGHRLSLRDRLQIHVGLTEGRSIRAIAAELGRAPSTISRELARNPGSRRRRYEPVRAHERAAGLARRPKPTKLAANPRLRAEVQARLADRCSPQQVTARLRLDFPDDEGMRVSHETIYRAIYVQGRGELRRELHQALRTGRAVRKQHGRVERRGRMSGMVMISERPAEVADRAIPGHWEGDLIVGKNNASAIGTLVERSTRFLMLLHVGSDQTAANVANQVIAQAAALPEHLRRSLTWDQGVEMARHTDITDATDMAVYFCDPHSPWQRGSNENTNGLLRQYFPKGTDLAIHTPAELEAVAAQMNRRPRKTLGWRTPAEALNEVLSQPPVALTL